ncbi:hypothetical protein FPV67DRAFT_1667410 [Lyophyllum atratum]|nr:hypothetical protein FPV67DRAFT_1667410 [Lyophyllum atratum]
MTSSVSPVASSRFLRDLDGLLADKGWLDSLTPEREKEQLAPIAHELLDVAMDRFEKEWFYLTKNIPKSNPALSPEDSPCAICGDSEGESSNTIVYRDGCNFPAQQDCYGAPYVPEGEWLCLNVPFPWREQCGQQRAHGAYNWRGPDLEAELETRAFVCDIREGACIKSGKTFCFAVFPASAPVENDYCCQCKVLKAPNLALSPPNATATSSKTSSTPAPLPSPQTRPSRTAAPAAPPSSINSRAPAPRSTHAQPTGRPCHHCHPHQLLHPAVQAEQVDPGDPDDVLVSELEEENEEGAAEVEETSFEAADGECQGEAQNEEENLMKLEQFKLLLHDMETLSNDIPSKNVFSKCPSVFDIAFRRPWHPSNSDHTLAHPSYLPCPLRSPSSFADFSPNCAPQQHSRRQHCQTQHIVGPPDHAFRCILERWGRADAGGMSTASCAHNTLPDSTPRDGDDRGGGFIVNVASCRLLRSPSIQIRTRLCTRVGPQILSTGISVPSLKCPAAMASPASIGPAEPPSPALTASKTPLSTLPARSQNDPGLFLQVFSHLSFLEALNSGAGKLDKTPYRAAGGKELDDSIAMASPALDPVAGVEKKYISWFGCGRLRKARMGSGGCGTLDHHSAVGTAISRPSTVLPRPPPQPPTSPLVQHSQCQNQPGFRPFTPIQPCANSSSILETSLGGACTARTSMQPRVLSRAPYLTPACEHSFHGGLSTNDLRRLQQAGDVLETTDQRQQRPQARYRENIGAYAEQLPEGPHPAAARVQQQHNAFRLAHRQSPRPDGRAHPLSTGSDPNGASVSLY